jgi:NTP pyrophosphatase (non-canonical NTP hydrolase)
MEFNRYQDQANATDQYQDSNQTLETGFQNIFEVADSLRLKGIQYLDVDKRAEKIENKVKIVERLGDCLWYISTISKRLGVDLDDVAQVNLKKLGERWEKKTSVYQLFDELYPTHEQLPRNLSVEIKEVPTGGGVKVMVNTLDRYNRQVGDRVNDNWHVDDGYRFHDVLSSGVRCVLRLVSRY